MIGYLMSFIGLAFLLIVWLRYQFGTKKAFKSSVSQALQALEDQDDEMITAKDIENLPETLQTYLIKSKVVGSPKVRCFHVLMEGAMKLDQDKPFAPVKADQYTFIQSGIRLFYMTMTYQGLPISGLHHYHSDDAFMKVKLLDLIKVVDHSGPKMHKAETVTYFNDLCIMAPGGLLEEDIEWEVIDDQIIRGTLRKHGHEVRARLTFNSEGMLENFISEDRLELDREGKEVQVPWSTPMIDFGPVDDYFLANKGSAIWHHETGDFEYIKLKIHSIKVNSC